jgi:uncharacterized membrane protein YhiD involved in acid resistance
MGSRLLPLSLAVGALLADSAGLHSLAFYTVLLAIPCAAGAAFLGAGDALQGKDVLRGVTTCLAAALLVLASAVRAGAPEGAAVPALAVSALVAAVVVYGLPLFAWLLEPLKPRPRSRAARIRTSP